MKQTLLLLLALTLSASMASAKKSPAEKAAGEYTGLLYIGMGNPVAEDTESQSATIKMEKQTETTVKFTLPNFKYGSLSLGDIELNNIPVYEKEDGTIAFGENSPQSLSLSIVSANVNIDHTTSYVNEGHAFIDVFVTTYILFSNVNIYVRFVGDNDTYEPEGIAHEMEGTHSGTIYSDLTPLLSSESAHNAGALQIVADGPNAVRLFLSNVEIEGLFIEQVVFSTTVVDNGDGTVSFAKATDTGSIAGTTDYKMTLLDGKNSTWSTDSIGLTIEAEINETYFYIVFTTGTLPPPIEDDPTPTTGPAVDIAGEYTAGIYINLGTPVTDETSKFTESIILLTAQDESTVTFALKDFSLDGVNSLGDIVLKDVPVIDNGDGTYRFGPNEPQSVTLGGGAIIADVKIDDATSYVADENLYIDVPVQAMGEYIYVHVGLPVTATAISTVLTAAPASHIIYDLSGRRYTQRPNVPGVYIVGGKKVYIR